VDEVSLLCILELDIRGYEILLLIVFIVSLIRGAMDLGLYTPLVLRNCRK